MFEWYHCFHKNIKQQNEKYLAANQHIRMISEGLCDTETSLCKQQQIINISMKQKQNININACVQLPHQWAGSSHGSQGTL